MSLDLSHLHNPAVLVAFGGWNDAADSASNVLQHFSENYTSKVVKIIDSEDFFDFQVSRPLIQGFNSDSRITWPKIEISVVNLVRRDLVLIAGPEPNLKWRSLTKLLANMLLDINPALVVLMGAMLSDTPHTRPLPVSGTSNNIALAEKLSLNTSNYEGPTGIIGVLAEGFQQAGLPTMSLWASVPHYVSNPPNPKATLALLNRLQNILEEPIILAELPQQAETWENGVNELADEDPDIAEYIQNLELRQDETMLPELSGDEIARELEYFLRKHRNDKK